LTNSQSATSREPHAEHLNGQSFSGPHVAVELAQPVERHQRVALEQAEAQVSAAQAGVRR